MIEKLPRSSGNIIGFMMSGKLSDEDYNEFAAAMEQGLKTHDKIRLVFELRDFHGWDMHAAWDDLKYSIKYNKYLERVALVGDKRWEEWIAKLTKLFAKGELCYFDLERVQDAWKWVQE